MTTATMPKFEADEEKRIFMLDGIRIVSISNVLKDNRLIDARYIPESATTRGTHAHSLLQFYDEGDYSQAEGERLGLHGHIESWDKLKARMGFEILENEIRRYDPLYRFCGRPDRVARAKVGSLPWLIDFKSGEPQDWHRYQLGGQQILLQAAKFYGLEWRRASVHTHADGAEATLIEHEDEADSEIFLALLAATQTRLRHDIIGWGERGLE